MPRLGVLNLKERSQGEGKILSATVTKEANRWYVSLTVEREIEDPKPINGQIVGIDVGLECFAAFSNGDQVYAPKPLANHLKRLQRASRHHSRKVKGSNKSGATWT